MRPFRLTAMFATVATIGLSQIATAGAATLEESIVSARRELEFAIVKLRLYQNVEYRQAVSDVDYQINLVHADVNALQKRIVFYSRSERYRYSRLTPACLQQAELALSEAKARRAGLYQQRRVLRQSFVDQSRLYQLRIAAARSRVIQLEQLR